MAKASMRERPFRSKFNQYIGKRFGRLTVISVERSQATREAVFLVRCDCGTEKTIRALSITKGATQSCGCLATELLSVRMRRHGGVGSAEYNTWLGLRARCKNVAAPQYEHYGGRGIKVCKRWDDSFKAFLADMGPRPSAKHSIDRIDNDGDYEPGNCRWATVSEQRNNMSSNAPITLGERTMNVTDWARELRLNRTTIMARLKRGWTAEQALTTPAVSGRNQFTPSDEATQ